MKQKITIVIDNDIYFWIKSNCHNVSQEVNNYFKSKIAFAGSDIEIEKGKIKDLLRNHKKLAERELQQAIILESKLRDLEAKEVKEYDMDFQEAINRSESIRRSGLLGKLGLKK